MLVAGEARAAQSLDIPAQPMAQALQALAHETGVSVLFLPRSVEGLRSRAVSGVLEPEAAARQMIGDAPLRVIRAPGGGLVVQTRPQEAAGPTRAPPPAAAPPPRVAIRPLPPPFPAYNPTTLPELVVTATRLVDTANRVPLSITATGQAGLDQRNIHLLQDMQATTPAMRITAASGSGTAIIAIRGILQTGPTAATTGFYLDETPLQRRSSGSSGGVNGTPLPALFDLERVEVLRGPQGTLFGGGSEGGTIRYIQPQPGLQDYSDYVRLQASATHHGGIGQEAGMAFGGPIVKDKLGFRASVFERRAAGYIDLVDPFTRKVRDKDANSSSLRSMRLAVTWAPTERIRANLSYVSTFSRDDHALDRMTVPIPDQIVVPRLCYDNRAITSLPITSAARTTPAPIGRGEAECAAARAAGRTTYETPAYALGPYLLKPYQSVENDVARTKASFRVYSLDLDYNADGYTAKSITSYSEDSPKQSVPQPFQVNRVSLAVSGDPNDPRNAHAGSQVIPSSIPFIPFLGPEGFKGPAHFTSRNPRYSFTQEFRLASQPDARPFTWVAGIFYSNIRIKPDITLLSDSNDYSLAQFGITDVQRYGIRSLQSAPGVYNLFARIQERLRDVELAGFGEVNYWATDRLKLIAGLRLSRIHFDYTHAEIGPSIGVDVATVANGGAFEGAVDESPATPRLGAQYFFRPDSSIYVTAAKGYRAGGVNTPVAQSQAGDSLARNFGAGFTVFNLPRTYASDSVWSYEAGVKARLFQRLQLNGAVYVIDWKNPQVSTLIPQSGATVTTNGVAARSRGFELEAQAALPAGFSAVGTLGYTKANYTRRSVAFVGFNGVEAVATLPGQRIPTPPVTASLGLRYDFRLGRPTAYVRGDWRYTGGFDTAPFGATTWNPDSNHFPSRSEATLRAGMILGGTELNLFVNNLFEPHSGQVSGGRTGCALPANGGTPACASYSAYEIFRYTSWGRPREIGVQLIHRH